jgi:uncharacterized membrane protein YczE
MPLVSQLDDNILLKVLALIIGILLASVGIGVYVSAGLGEGGVDTWMMFVSDKPNKEVHFIRMTMDSFLIIIGALLGGSIDWAL